MIKGTDISVSKTNGTLDDSQGYIPEFPMSIRSLLSRCHKAEPMFLGRIILRNWTENKLAKDF